MMHGQKNIKSTFGKAFYFEYHLKCKVQKAIRPKCNVPTSKPFLI